MSDIEKQRRKLNGKIYELKKDCYKFSHFYLTYEKIVDSYFEFDKKAINLLTFLKVCIQPFYIFCNQVLEIINRGFVVDDYDGMFEKPFFESEARKKQVHAPHQQLTYLK